MSRYQNDAAFKCIVEAIFIVAIIGTGIGVLYASNATSVKNTEGQKMAQIMPCKEDPKQQRLNCFVEDNR